MSTKESKLAALEASWIEAKENEKGWNEIRKQTEAHILEMRANEIAEVKAGLEAAGKLTTTIKIGKLDVTVGRDLKISQPAAIEFLSRHPAHLGVTFRIEYKPDSRAVLGIIGGGNALAKDLAEVVTFSDKSPSFSFKG